MASISQPKAETLTDFAKAAQEAHESNSVNSECRFSPNPETNIGRLAQNAYPNNPEKQEYYKAKIMASLEAWLAPGVSIQALWDYCASQYCQTTAIIEGILKFFAGEKGEKEINISKYLKPISLEATSTEEKVERAKKAEILGKTRLELKALLAEIQSGH